MVGSAQWTATAIQHVYSPFPQFTLFLASRLLLLKTQESDARNKKNTGKDNMYFVKWDVLPSQASSEEASVIDGGGTAGKHVIGLVTAP